MKQEIPNKITELTVEQEEILTGLMLGDGSLNKNKSPSAYLVVHRARKDDEYINTHINIFNNFKINKTETEYFDRRTNKTYFSSTLRTLSHPILTKWHGVWYKDKHKIIPNNLKLTPLTLATWFADDGSIFIRNKNKNNGHFIANISTHCFSKIEVEFLQKKLYKTFNLNFKIRKDLRRNSIQYFLILENSKEILKLIKIIDPVFPKGMERKSNIWRNNMNLLYKIKGYPKCPICDSQKTIKIGFTESKNPENKKQRYRCKDCNKIFKAKTPIK